jgi:hypothetical protein
VEKKTFFSEVRSRINYSADTFVVQFTKIINKRPSLVVQLLYHLQIQKRRFLFWLEYGSPMVVAEMLEVLSTVLKQRKW